MSETERSLLNDLVRHQQWADAEHWKAFERCPLAVADTIIRDRLYHIHVVQQAYCQMVDGQSIDVPELDSFPDFASLKAFARSTNEAFTSWVNGATESMWDKIITFPWFKEPPITLTIGEAVMQATMHSQYHRGQNATRLRELGGDPSTTDLVIWYWHGRPQAEWEG